VLFGAFLPSAASVVPPGAGLVGCAQCPLAHALGSQHANFKLQPALLQLPNLQSPVAPQEGAAHPSSIVLLNASMRPARAVVQS
jgi:hypothetical protein